MRRRPRRRAPRRLGIAAALVATFVLVPQTPAPTATAAADPRADLLKRINRARVSRGVPALRTNPVLTRPAVHHSRYLASIGTLDHRGADGRPFWVRLFRAGYPRNRAVGENLGMIGGCTLDAGAAMVTMWLESPSHRRNLLSRRFRAVGIAIVAAPDCSNTVYATTFGG